MTSREAPSGAFFDARKPRILDLFCCAGGAAKGYADAGFEVVGALLIDPIRLTGQHFGMTAPDVDGVPLKLVRTRLFESNVELRPPDSFTANRDIQTASVYGAGGGWTPRHRDNPDRRGGYIPHTDVLKRLLGIDWMTKREMSQSIPPAFTEHIGRQIIEHINQEEFSQRGNARES